LKIFWCLPRAAFFGVEVNPRYLTHKAQAVGYHPEIILLAVASTTARRIGYGFEIRTRFAEADFRALL